MRKRILSLILALTMVLLAIPATVFPVFAAEEEEKDLIVLSSTTFAPNQPGTWPVFDSYVNKEMNTGDHVGVTYQGGWQIGYKYIGGDSANFTAYDKLYKASGKLGESGHMILSSGTGYWTQWGGMYVEGFPYMLFSGATYNETPGGYDQVSAVANPTVRYTIKETGTVRINVNELYFNADHATHFAVYHNGVLVHDPIEAQKSRYRVESGSFVSKTGANAADAFETLILDVKKGDSIDFVSEINTDFNASNIDEFGLNKFDSAEYGFSKRGFYDFGFTIDYIVEKTSYKTRFAPDAANTFPVFGNYSASSMNVSQYVSVSYPGAWQIGYRDPQGSAANFHAYDKLYKASGTVGETGQMILSTDWSFWSNYGGMYITGSPNLMFSGMTYSEDYTSVTEHKADPVIRYTAEYTGTALIRVNELFFYADNTAYFEILHNGEPLIDPVLAVTAQNRVTDGAYASAGAANVGGDFATLLVDLKEGDTIDFVSRGNDAFNGSATEALGLTKFDKKEYDYSKRGILDFDFEIEYRSVKDGSSSQSITMQAPGILPEPLFVWYDANGNMLETGATRTAHDNIPEFTDEDIIFSSIGSLFDWLYKKGGCYAKINPVLLENGTISETDNYGAVLSAYKTYLASFPALSMASDFKYGAGTSANLTTFDRLCFFAASNPFGVGQNGNTVNGSVDYLYNGNFFAPQAQFTAALDAFIGAAAAVTPSGTNAGDFRLNYATLPDGATFAPQGVDAIQNGASLIQNNSYLYFAPDANGGKASFVYTVPTGYDRPLFSFTANDVRFDGEEAPFHYAIAINGKVVWPAGATADSVKADCNSNTGWALYTTEESFKNTLSALHFEVKSGDVVELCIARAYRGGEALGAVAVGMDLTATTENYHDVCALDIVRSGKHLYRALYEFGSSVTLADLDLPDSFGANGVYINNEAVAEDLPESLVMCRTYRITDKVLETSASLSIASSFAINIYVQTIDDATAAGVVVDGEKIEGILQSNNVYKCTIPVAPKELPTMVIAYRAYQTADGKDMVNADPVELNAFELLSAYEASTDETTRLLAKTIRYYSLAARDYFINGRVTLSEEARNGLLERDDAILSMVEAYQAGNAFRPYPADVNANDFTFRFTGATLKLDDSLAFAFRVDRTSGTLFGEPNLTLQVKDENGELRYLGKPEFLFDEEGKEMLYFVSNLPAAEYGKEFFFTLVDENGTAQSATLTYSVHAYVARIFSATSNSSTLSYLLRGIYAIGEVTTAYLEEHAYNYNPDFVYEIGDGGDSLQANSPVLNEVTYNINDATDISATDFLSGALVSGKVYRVNGNTLSLSSKNSTAFNANGAILIAADGLIIDGCNSLTVSNLAVAGPVIIRNSSNVIFENCQFLTPSATAVTVEGTADLVVFNACRIIGQTALANAGNELTLMNSYVGFSENGVMDTAAFGTTVQNCRLVASGSDAGTAIRSSASESAFRFNTILHSHKTGIGIDLAGDGEMLNVLVAQNVVTGTLYSLRVSGALNASVVLNSFVHVEASDNKNLYISDNAIGGRIAVQNNNYLLVDGNFSPSDNMDHSVYGALNTNTNGDNLMDINARADAGAKEELLPHVDKDLFVGMERKETVKDVTFGSAQDVYAYIKTNSQASNSHYIVVAPGAYVLREAEYAGTWGLELSNATANGDRIYAYGVCAEYDSSLMRHLNITNVKNLAIKGLTVSYAAESLGQVHVVEKLSTTTFRVVAPAGMSANLFRSGGGYLHRTARGEDFIFCDVSFSSVVDNGDSTWTVTMPAANAELVSVGDSFTCRASTGATTIVTSYCEDILLQDMTVYGTSVGLCMQEGNNTGYVTYHRILDTNRNGRVIDEATYNTYAALESKYGVDLDISIDAQGRFRGTKQLIGSVDATHVVSCKYGSQIISCIFENMCDDGTNQKSYSGRLAEVTDNGNGTTTITYKSVLSTHQYGRGENGKSTNICPEFLAGERVYAYTAAGRLVCDTTANADAVYLGSYKFTDDKGVERTYYRYSVTVATSAVNFDALEGYDLSKDDQVDEHKVLIDNRTRASNGFRIENTVVDGTRSRGLLIKSSDGIIRNCTLRNVAKVGIAVLYEISWGESGVSENLLIENNLFDNVSYSVNNSGHYAHYPIFIKGLSSTTDTEEEYLSYKDITIRGNVFRRRYSDTAVYVQSAQRVTIIENDFGTAVGESAADPKPSLTFNGARDVEISRNTYSPYITDIYGAYTGDAIKNLHGSDVSKYPFHDEEGDLHIRYQDTYTFPVAIEAVENVVITSKVTGKQEMDANLLVIKEDGKSVYADGCGTATVCLANGSKVNVIVEASDISLFFVTGQSNASGDHSFSDATSENYQKYHHTYADYFIRTAPTMAYFTFTGQALSLTGDYNPENSVTDTLDWDSIDSNDQKFVDPKVFSIPVGSTSFGNAGWSAALAHEWVEQTGERVWIVNASHGGHGIAEFEPSADGTPVDNDYYQAVAVFNEALKTLYAEVDAGHFTLSHMAYYWFHGCADYQQTEEYYTTGFSKMHLAMQADVVYNHAGVEHKLEYCGLMDIRSKHDSSGNSYAEKYLTGPRLSHYQAAGATTGVFHNVYIASNVTERWLGDDQNVVDYFLETYGSAENFKKIFGYDMPTTRWELHPNVHYLMKGHNEMGMDCARNTLRIINARGVGKTYVHDYVDNTAPTVTLVGRDGHTSFDKTIRLEQDGTTTVVPMVTPSWRTMEGVYLVSETAGFTFDGFTLTATDPNATEITIGIYLGGKKLESRTMTVAQISAFSNNTPENDGSTVTMTPPWSIGSVSLSGGAFAPYSHITSGWVSGVAGSAHHATGSFLLGSWNASLQTNMTAAAAITYTAERDGFLAIGAENFNPAVTSGATGTFLAVMVNGRMVWPTKTSAPYSLPTSTTDATWQYMAKTSNATDELNALWADLRIMVKTGDLVQFCMVSDATRSLTGGESTTNAQPILMPYVLYVAHTHSSAFLDNTPVISGSTATMTAPWSIGGVKLASTSNDSRTFTPYTYVTVTSGWVSSVAGSAHNTAGSFWATNSWRASMQENMTSAPAICYTAEKAGTIAISVDRFEAANPGLAGATGTFLAVMINGKMVWPASTAITSLPTSTSSTTWRYMDKNTVGTEELNELWADVRLTVAEGDLVQFCMVCDSTRALIGNTNSQPILHPVITYGE